ncbi:MAG: hypothetical protein R6V58_12275 [Planctomycetota bacterium]
MSRVPVALALVCLIGSVAFGGDVSDRALVEGIVSASLIVRGEVGEAAGTFKEGRVPFQKFKVTVAEVVHAEDPDAGEAPKKGAEIIVYDGANIGKGDDRLMFLGAASENGRPVHASVDDAEAARKRVRELLKIRTNAGRKLGGKNRLVAAVFLAHELRPLYRANAEGKGLKAGGQVPDETKEKLLAALVWAFKESAKKDATPDRKQLTEMLRTILTGAGGLKEYNTLQKRLAQHWTNRLKTTELRKKQKLARLELVVKSAEREKKQEDEKEKPQKQKAVVRLGQQGVARQVLVARAIRAARQKAQEKKAEKAEKKEEPEPVPVTDQPVNGLALELKPGRETYNLAEHPDQPIAIRATFRNAGNRPMRINTYLIFARLGSVHVHSPSGKHRTYRDTEALHADTIPAMGTWSFKRLKPGETIAVRHELPADLFRQPGRYRLTLAYSNPYGKRFGLSDAWTGRIAADAELTIVKQSAPEPEPPEKEPEPEKQADKKQTAGRVIELPEGTVQVHVGGGAPGAKVQVIIDGEVVKPNAP